MKIAILPFLILLAFVSSRTASAQVPDLGVYLEIPAAGRSPSHPGLVVFGKPPELELRLNLVNDAKGRLLNLAAQPYELAHWTLTRDGETVPSDEYAIAWTPGARKSDGSGQGVSFDPEKEDLIEPGVRLQLSAKLRPKGRKTLAEGAYRLDVQLDPEKIVFPDGEKWTGNPVRGGILFRVLGKE